MLQIFPLPPLAKYECFFFLGERKRRNCSASFPVYLLELSRWIMSVFWGTESRDVELLEQWENVLWISLYVYSIV